MKQNSAVRLIGNSFAGLFFLGLALYAQTPHTQNAFLELGHDRTSGYAQFNSWGYAIALELAVLYFTVRGNFRASYIFAVVSVAMNLAYYTIHGNNMLDIANWPRWLISVSLPLAIAYYSHCIADAESVDVFAGLKAKMQSWYARLTSKQEIVQEAVMQTPVQEEPVQTPVQEDAQPSDLSLQIAALRANQIPDEEIATKHLRKVPGLHIAPLLQVHASTVSRWRKESNGFHKEPA